MSCCDHDCFTPQTDERYRRVLWAALAVNLAMFLVEIVAGIIAGSVSLRADALDFLADAANYAVCPRRGRSGTALARLGGAAQGRCHGPVRFMGRRQHGLPCDHGDGAAC